MPLPEWHVLINALLRTLLKMQEPLELSRPWDGVGNHSFWLSRSAWSLALIMKVRRIRNANKKATIWVPDFFCNSSLQPMRDIGIDIIFYPITKNFLPDEKECEKLKLAHDLDAFLLVHYFGRHCTSIFAKRFCQLHGGWLIEDAAHVMVPVSKVGTLGDFVLYSPHKHLALPDGALLIVSANGPSQILSDSKVMDSLRYLLRAYSKNTPPIKFILFWVLKRTIQKLGFFRRPFALSFEGNALSAMHPYKGMSLFSKFMLGQMINQLSKFQLQRHENFNKWKLFFSVVGIDLLPYEFIDEKDEGTPYIAPFFNSDIDECIKIFSVFESAGLAVSTWPDLPPEIFQDKKNHHSARAIRNTGIYFPVHQTLDLDGALKVAMNRVVRSIGSELIASEISEDEWKEKIARSRNINLMQSWSYGTAKENVSKLSVRRLAVSKSDGEVLGLAQLLYIKIPVLGLFCHINQGPIIVSENECMQFKDPIIHLSESLRSISAIYCFLKKENLRFLQIAPYLKESILASFGMSLLGFQSIRNPVAWKSSIVDISRSPQEIMSRFSSKWRGGLRKSFKCQLIVKKRDVSDQSVSHLSERYKILQLNKGFEGIGTDLIASLAKEFGKGNDDSFNFYTAHIHGNDDLKDSVGTLVTIKIGKLAFYLIGESGASGRAVQANTGLLWAAIEDAKSMGCLEFDLGGLGANSARGVIEFKRALKGVEYTLVGEWRRINKNLLRN